LEPWDLPDNFFSLFENPRLMPHLHLPLQSGSDSVLRRMARRCKTQEFAEIVSQARAQIPHFNLTTDIIVGFPGETEQEWQESYAFIKAVGFGHIHIFSYSPRAGTKAASLPNPVLNEIKKQRSQQLHELAQTMKQAFTNSQLGQSFSILWEGQREETPEGQTLRFGYTPNYLRVACVEEDDNLENKITMATLESIGDDYILTLK
jgi:threonylcarbamoyladenosine tRNA methylthiotransferase MtaB